MRMIQFNTRLNDDELSRLQRLAQHLNVAPQDLVRMLIKRESDALARAAK